MKKFLLISLLSVFAVSNIFSQEKKTVTAVRINKAPKIDGKIDEIWKKIPATSGFYEYDPGNGDPLPPDYKTEVKVAYDDKGLYILAVMHDPEPDKIVRIFGLRDDWTLSDRFMILLNPFKAPGNNYIFEVSASGAQLDALQSGPNETDLSWNAVWNSAVQVTKYGWVAEFFIPYSALRFPKKNKQEWAINFSREIVRTRKKYLWTKLDKTKKADLLYFMGRLTGIENINPPLRLSFYPYFSLNTSRYQGKNEVSPAFGMDLKYGLNENFTLDATLIPDFSDVPYDDVVLNLGPFEQFYSENRPFFTEGMQLFNRGNIFYSRRIGSQPIDYYKPYYIKNPTEIIEENPEKTKLINALKISGRTDNGLGIGILNAVTNKSEAVLLDTLTGNQRHVLTAPYTNYNVSVLDYAFGDNNSVGIMNLNTFRAGDYKDANVTSAFYKLYLMKNTLEISGSSNVSFIHDSISHPGFYNEIEISKQLKEHGFGLEFTMADTQYDINDLGFMRHNNYVIYDFFYNYSILKPTKHFNRLRFSMDIGLDHVFKPYGLYRKDIGFGMFATTRKFLSFGGRIQLVSDTKDYYEPRIPGKVYIDPAKMRFFSFFSTDYRKKFAFDVHISGHNYLYTCGNGYNISFSPRFRPSNQLRFNYEISYGQNSNQRGFVTYQGGEIIFGNRNTQTVSQKLSGNYYFTVKSAISISVRHYWAPVHYTAYFKLNDDGSLTKISLPGRNDDINFNVWNLDFGYSWEFAPGSQLTLLYRNSLQNVDRQSNLTFGQNWNNLFRQDQQHNFIIKAIYYLDYNTNIKKWF